MERITKTFIADGSGNEVSFVASGVGITIDTVSLKKVTQQAVEDNIPVKEFLVGNTDEGKEINFRVDTQLIQLMPEFETFANPLAVVTKLQRGTMVKCFIALGDEDFYELEGSATKARSVYHGEIHRNNCAG